MDDLRSRLKRVMDSLERRGAGPGVVLLGPGDGHWGDEEAGSDRGRPGTLAWRQGREHRRVEWEGHEREGERVGVEKGRGKTLEEVLGGREVETAHGKLFEIAQTFRCGYRHGRYRLEEFSSLDLGVLDFFCGGACGGYLDEQGFLFLDLETTGLSLGTGTYAFLVGMGYFRDGKYHLRQFLLRDFEEEICMISHLKEWMEGCAILVTFNGKRFDVPVLETRFAMCGKTLDVGEKGHWDLLYSSRRLWQGRAENCRLGTLERDFLGVERGMEDIPGSMIPALYYRYVHDGDTRDLDRIVYHNAMDVLTLTTLAIHTARCIREKDPGSANLVAMGGFFESKGMPAEGMACYEIAAGQGCSAREREEALYRLGVRMKRQGKRMEAIRLWEQVVGMGGHRMVDGCEEAAKVYEHDIRDMDRAIGLVRFALKELGGGDQERRDGLLRRLSRLERKRGVDWSD